MNVRISVFYFRRRWNCTTYFEFYSRFVEMPQATRHVSPYPIQSGVTKHMVKRKLRQHLETTVLPERLYVFEGTYTLFSVEYLIVVRRG